MSIDSPKCGWVGVENFGDHWPGIFFMVFTIRHVRGSLRLHVSHHTQIRNAKVTRLRRVAGIAMLCFWHG